MTNTIDTKYDFFKFIKRCIGLSYLEIISKAEQQVAWAECLTLKERADGAGQYAAELKSFLFFLRHGQRPSSGSFLAYRPVVESLVTTGELNPSALDVFRNSASSS